MNERIEELADQCMVEYQGDSGVYYEEFDRKKFAELIVKECAGLLEKEANSNHDEGTESYNALIRESKWMKRYFGVE